MNSSNSKKKKRLKFFKEYKLEIIIIPMFLLVFLVVFYLIPDVASGKIDTSVGIASAVISFFTWFGVRSILHKKSKALSDNPVADTGSVALMVYLGNSITQNVIDHFENLGKLKGDTYKGDDIRNGSFLNNFEYEQYAKDSVISKCDITKQLGNSDKCEINLLRNNEKGKYIEFIIKELPTDSDFNPVINDLYSMIDSLTKTIKTMGISRIHFFFAGPAILQGLFEAEFVNCFEVYYYYWKQDEYLYAYSYNRGMEMHKALLTDI